jgi:hypothetical protein
MYESVFPKDDEDTPKQDNPPIVRRDLRLDSAHIQYSPSCHIRVYDKKPSSGIGET